APRASSYPKPQSDRADFVRRCRCARAIGKSTLPPPACALLCSRLRLRFRFGQPIALDLRKAFAADNVGLRLGLDALGRGGDAEAGAEARNRAHDGERFLVALAKPFDEA